MTIRPLRRLTAPSAATVLWALLSAAGCGSGADPVPASFDPLVASRYGSAWTVDGTCGDGVLDAGEGCDDGNGLPGDGCSAACIVETDYTCTTATPINLSNGRFNVDPASQATTTVTGWTVQSGNVDLVVPVEPQASWLLTAEGPGMVDLAGSANGELRQDVATSVGQTYNLHFAYAARCPGTAPCARTFRVDVADVGSGTVLTTAKFTGLGDPQPAWQIGKVFFKATGLSSQIRLVATDVTDTVNGALIDAVTFPASTCYLVPQLSCMTPQTASGDLSLNGVASIGTDSILANPASGSQLGAAFSTRTFAPSSFTAVARLRTGSPSATAADGFALVFQNDPRGAAAIGCPGEGLGYGQQPTACTTAVNGIKPSIAVELDTYWLNSYDAGINAAHIAIDANGDVTHVSPFVVPTFSMINATFTVWVDYNLATRTLQVFGSSGTLKPANPILVYTLTPAQAAVFDNPFYAGITGSTGGSWESQEILYYSISTTGIVDVDGDGKDDRCTVCGNGYVDVTGEECDDGNLAPGDGCSATCTREPGMTCGGIPSVCVGRCGDGIVASTEGCDDGNTTNGDGCSSACQPESGWVCSAPPAVDTTLVVGASSCADPGSTSVTYNETSLPAGRYGLFYVNDAVQTDATPTYEASIAARSSTDGTSWSNTSVVSSPASTSAAAIGNAMGNRGFFRTDGSTSWFFFPDTSCGDDTGTTTWRLKGVSRCEQTPDTSVVTMPASLSNTVAPSFTFSATIPASTFECSLDGAPFTACTSPNGYIALAQGPHDLLVRAVNGPAIDPTPAAWSWTIDSLVSAPVITFPVAASQVPGSPTIAGLAEAGATVSVNDGGAPFCITAADPSGNWSCPTTYGDGSHTVQASQQDLAGNVSSESSVTFTVATNLPDVTLPAAAVVNAANAAAYPVSGGCTASDGDVTVTVGSKSATVPCVADAFSATLDLTGAPAVPDAPSVAVTASQTNVNGTGTAARATPKDTVVAAPIVSAPSGGALVAADPTVAGTSEAGATVVIRNGVTVLCTVTADPLGGWSCATTLAAGPYSLTAIQTDVAGNPSAAATADFTVVAPPVVAVGSSATIWSGNAAAYPVTGACGTLSGPVTVTIGAATATAPCAGNAFSATLDVSGVADAPAVTITATQTNPAGTGSDTQAVVKDTAAAPPVIASPADGADAPANPTLAGNTEDFATVTVEEGAATICVAAADSKGNWSCATTLGAGSHTLTSTMVDAAGNASGTATRVFMVVAPPAVTITGPGPINIANNAAYLVSGTCSAGDGNVTVTVGTLAFQNVACAVGGTFGATFNASGLADSLAVPVSAVQTNGAGTTNVSRTALKDTTAPGTPAITAPAAAATLSAPAPGPASVDFVGTAQAGATVAVTESGVPLCSGVASAAGTWICTAPAMAAGSHTVVAVATDVAGNASGATGNRTFTLNFVTGLPVVALTTPGPINAANTTAYTVSGTCTAGSGNVTINVGNATANPVSTACTAGGTFSTTMSTTGQNASTTVLVSAAQTNVNGTGTDSQYTIKDVTAPGAPTLTAPAAAAQVTAATTISGTSENLATVAVSEGAVTVCTASASAAGAWSCAVTLSVGAHSITATQTDRAGNTGAASGPRAFTVVAPPSVAIDPPAVINAGNAGSYTVSGTCLTGASTVAVTVGSISAPTSPTCTAGGTFSGSFSVSTLADASNVLVTATQSNVAGTTVASASTRKDTVAAPPVIVLPVEGAVVPPNPTLSGTAEPGATVTVVRAGPVTVCTAVADGAGSWSCATTLGVGSYSLTASQVDTAGNASSSSPARSVTVEVLPVVTLDPPDVITSANAPLYPVSGTCTGTAFVSVAVGTATGSASCSGGVFARTLDVTAVPDAAAVTVSASQSNAAGSDGDSASVLKDATALPPAITSPAAGSEVAASASVAGTAEPLATVYVCEAGAPLCEAGSNLCADTADGSGNWSCGVTLAVGDRSLVARQVDVLLNESAASAPHALVVVAVPVVTVTAPGPINLANRTAYPVAGSCTGSYAVDLQVGSVTATTSCSGSAFSTTLDVASLADSPPAIDVSASQTNVAGTGSDSRSAVKDTVAPAAPSITAPAAGSEVDVDPELSGSGAEPGALVTVREGAATVCADTADALGDWACTGSLGNGSHTLTAAQTDTAGNPGPASADHTFWIGPPAVALDAPVTVTSANASSYAVSGTCTGAADVTVTVGTATASPSPACAAGAFTVTFDVSAVGDAASVGVSVSQTNAFGTGTDSATVEKDTVALPPIVSSPAAASEVGANPTVSGTAEAGGFVTVLDGIVPVCTVSPAPVDGAGDWSCATSLGVGSHTLTATQVDAHGNPSSASPDRTFTVVALPVVALTAPVAITSLNEEAYPVAGSCTGSYTVTVQVGALPSQTTACAAGAFSTTVNVTSLGEGSGIDVSASQTNAAGTGSDSATTLKDTFAAPPVIAAPAQDSAVPANPPVSGSGADALATVFVCDAGAPLCDAANNLCADTADGAGLWTCDTTLGNGSHSVVAVQRDGYGNASVASAGRTFFVGPPQVALDPLLAITLANGGSYLVTGTCSIGQGDVTVSVVSGTTVTQPVACSGTGTFATASFDVSSVDDGLAVAVSASQTNAVDTTTAPTTVVKDTTALPPLIASPAQDSAVPANPTVTGSGAEPLAAVFVCDAGAPLCDAADNLCADTADGAGLWSCDSTLGNGSHSVVAVQRDGYGNASVASAGRTFFVGPPQVALGALLAITPANANVSNYAVTGTCSIGQGDVTVTVGAGPTATLTVACGAAGTFTTSGFDVSGVDDGLAVAVSASQTNAVDVTTASSTVLKDTVALPPVISSPLENAQVSTSVTFAGTAEPDADVTVTDGALGCTGTADALGDWSCTATFILGLHTVTATQLDPHGNGSAASAGRTFEVIDLPVVALDPLAAINLGNVTDYVVTGSCSIGQGDVTVTVGAGPVATQTVACSLGGAFTTSLFDVSAVGDAASVAVRAAQTNGSGTDEDVGTTVKDVVLPAAPAIASPAAGAETSPRPSFSGTAEPGATVTVREGTDVVCSGLADGAGNWSCTAGADLAAGARALTAAQTDAAGNPGAATASLSITVVVAPVVTLTAPATINSVNDGAYAVTGSCSGSWSVTADVGGVSGSAPCSGGAFAVTLDVTGVADGPAVAVTVTQTNAAGSGTDSGTALKETILPEPPAVDSPAPGDETSPLPTFTGTGELGATVTVREGATVVCAAVVDAAGGWSCTATSNLTEGVHSLAASLADASGNPAAATTPLSITVVAPPAVTLTAPSTINSVNDGAYAVTGTCSGAWSVTVDVGGVSDADDCSAGTFTVTLDVTGVADGPAVAVTASQTNASGSDSAATTTLKETALPAAPAVGSPAADAETAARPTFSGTAEPNATVELREGATLLCSDVADGAGDWSCTPATALAAGPHALAATQIDANGNPGTDATALSITVVVAPVVTLAAPAIINSLNDGAYAVTGTCAGAWSVDVTVGTASGSAPCSGGAFTVTLDVTGLPDGSSVAVTATQGNAAGTSVRAATTPKDTVAAAPVVLAPAANATVAPSPSVSGLAEPGATVTVTEGATLCTSTADGFGNWSCATTLGAGGHTVSAIQTDAAGNVSAPASRSFTVDVAVPVVVLADPAVINGANAAAYPVGGACDAGSGDVTVSVGTLTRTVPCAGGAFATTLDVRALAESPSVTVAASQTLGGRTGSDVRTTPKDTVANPPAIVSPAAGASVPVAPSLAGTAEPLATIVVSGPASGLGGCAGPFAADAAGAWSCSTALPLGTHTVVVSQTDEAGNDSATTSRTFTVVGVPVVALDPLPDVNGANVASYAVIGTCDPAAGDVTVTVAAGAIVASSTCGGTFAVALDLTGEPDAPVVTVSAAQTTVSGTGTDTRSVLKDTVALSPTIASPAAGGNVAPNPVASGTAEPGAGVTVAEGGTLLCSATADDLGRWSCATSLSGAGAHTIDATQTDPAGNASPAASRTFTVTASLPSVTLAGLAVINAANAAAYPVAGTCTAGDGDVTITVGSASPATTACTAGGTFGADVSTAGQPEAAVVTVTASQTNGAGAGSAALTTLKDTISDPPVVTSPEEGADVPTPRPAISGTAEAGALVVVLVDGVEIGRATAAADGAWSVAPASDLGPGSRTASVTQLDLAGNTSDPALRTFVVDTGTAPTVTLPAPWAVLDFDQAIVFAGLAAPGATVTVAVDAAVVGTVTADGAGAWALTLAPRTIAVGLHAVTATADGLSSAPVGFTIRLPETELTGGGCGCQGSGGAGGWLALLSVLAAALRRRPRRVTLSA